MKKQGTFFSEMPFAKYMTKHKRLAQVYSQENRKIKTKNRVRCLAQQSGAYPLMKFYSSAKRSKLSLSSKTRETFFPAE